jgi:hypothetical protein
VSRLGHAFFPIWRLGYRCNPFRTLTREEWHELALLPEGLKPILDTLPPLTQILGEQGRGKTSALIGLAREYGGRGWKAAYEYLPPGSKRYKHNLKDIQIYLLDEAQRLSPQWRGKLFRHFSNGDQIKLHLILSSHEDLSGTIEDIGLDVLTIVLEQHKPSFIQALIEHRLNYFERPGSQGVRLTAEALGIVIDCCNSNLRRLEELLYEVYQTWESKDSISEQHILGIMTRLD